MKRRDFVRMGVLSVPSIALAQSVQERPKVQTIPAGADRLDEAHTLGFSKIAFKASPVDTAGGLFIMEHSNLTKGVRTAICIRLRMNGYTRWRANSASKSAIRS